MRHIDKTVFETLCLLGLSVMLMGLVIAQTPMLSYSEFRQMLGGYRERQILLTAVELNVFTAVGQEATAAQLSSQLETDKRATETFLNALVAMGALNKQEGIYHNTPMTARYLVDRSRDSTRASLLHTVHMSKPWSTLTECVRAGTAVTYQEMADRGKEWMEAFISAMHQGGLQRAPRLVEEVGVEGVDRLLDIGGGSGIYSIAFAQAQSTLQAVVIDLPYVVEIAQRHIKEAGLADRVTTRVADLRTDDFGKDYDLILLSAICHMLSPQQNENLFQRCYRALAPEGRIVIRDFILEPNKTAPQSAALFALHMLVATEGGGTYTGEEYRNWLQRAGLTEVSRLAGDLIVARRR